LLKIVIFTGGRNIPLFGHSLFTISLQHI
jgi:hypothetical protein